MIATITLAARIPTRFLIVGDVIDTLPKPRRVTALDRIEGVDTVAIFEDGTATLYAWFDIVQINPERVA